MRTWVVPAVIVRQIEAKLGGRAEIESWWLNGHSAGVTGLQLHEGPTADAPTWASADRVSTDLALGKLLRGEFSVGRVRLDRPEVTIRLNQGGDLLTPIGIHSKGSSSSEGTMPVVIANGAKVSVQQEGRPAMVVHGVTARLGPDTDGSHLVLSVRSNDREWGPFEAIGSFDSGFKTGRIDMKSQGGIEVTPDKASAIPFVPARVWENVAPRGEVDVRLTVELGDFDGHSTRVKTEIGLRGTTVTSQTLGLTAEGSTGRVTVDGSLVRLENVSGRAIDGRVSANGTLDFRPAPPRFDLNLDLEHLEVADAPPSWQLDEAGVTGHLTGKARLVAALKPAGVDLSGTSGEAVVRGGTIQGIPFKSLRLVMNAQGSDLRYETPSDKPSPTSRIDAPKRPENPFPDRLSVLGSRLSNLASWLALSAEGLLAPPEPDEGADKPAQRKNRNPACGCRSR